MHRRRLLAAGGLVLASGLAGCLGGGREALEERPPENAVEDALRVGIGHANTAAIELGASLEGVGSPGQLAVDRAPLADRLSTARSHLDDAAGMEGADAYDVEIAAARAYTDAVEGLVTGAAEIAGAAEALTSLESAVGDGEYDGAGSTISDVQPPLDDAVVATDEGQAAIEDLGDGTLDPYGAQVDRVSQGLATISDLAVGGDALATGYESVLAGRDHLANGRDEFEAGDYGGAESAFAAAQEDFASATTTFEDGRAETGVIFATRFDTAICRSTNLDDAAGNFAAATAAARQGDPLAANSEYQRGEDALAAVANC